MITHNGIFTIESPRGGHRTLRIKTARRGKLQGKRILSMLSGPDNQSDYRGFAFVEENGVHVWRASRGTGGKASVYEIYGAMLWSMLTRGDASQFARIGYVLHAETVCRCCNRKLTTPESIKSGIGPICDGRTNIEHDDESDDTMPELEFQLEGSR